MDIANSDIIGCQFILRSLLYISHILMSVLLMFYAHLLELPEHCHEVISFYTPYYTPYYPSVIFDVSVVDVTC